MPHAIADVSTFEPIRVKTLPRTYGATNIVPQPSTVGREFEHIYCQKLHPTFGAEVFGVDFSQPVSQEVFADIEKALAKYAVLVFRHCGFNDERHVKFSRMFGELDDASPYIPPGSKHRFDFIELFDVGNVEENGEVTKIGSRRHHMQLGNYGFHSDLAYNPRRAGVSLLRAAQLPPPGYGGGTDFADTRKAYEDLPADLLKELEEGDYIGAHNLVQSRIRCAPADSPWTKDLDPEQHSFGRHSIIQTHEASGRKVLYLANHLHHLEYKTPRSKDFVPTKEQPYERVPQEIGWPLIEKLLAYAEQPQFVLEVEWENDGDLIAWDNTASMHRSHGGGFTASGFKRDMRRCTSHDNSPTAWGYNDKKAERQRMTYKH